MKKNPFISTLDHGTYGRKRRPKNRKNHSSAEVSLPSGGGFGENYLERPSVVIFGVSLRHVNC